MLGGEQQVAFTKLKITEQHRAKLSLKIIPTFLSFPIPFPLLLNDTTSCLCSVQWLFALRISPASHFFALPWPHASTPLPSLH